MRAFICIIFITVFILSCNNRQSNSKNETFEDTLFNRVTSKTLDSLDVDTISSMSSNLTDTVRSILRPIADSIWKVVDKSVINSRHIKDSLLTDTLSKFLQVNNFEIEYSKNTMGADKKLFNKRLSISWQTIKPYKITLQIICWQSGKRYILIEQRFAGD